MFHLPFVFVSDTFQQLIEKILKKIQVCVCDLFLQIFVKTNGIYVFNIRDYFILN